MFLSSDDLPELLAGYGDVIQLALFAHTHMDEMRLLKPEGSSAIGAAALGVAVKLVPSISPINGNAPSFTIATIEPKSATLEDYRVFVASTPTGTNTWSEEYDYAKTYREKAFSAAVLSSLVKGFQSDSAATTDTSEAYLRNYFVRDRSLELRLFWPQYTCALSGEGGSTYKACVCGQPHP